MSEPDRPAPPGAERQRDTLKDAERTANEKQPGNFKEKETDDKIVEIPPLGEDKKPIGGLDSK